jgi:hypothetical protein
MKKALLIILFVFAFIQLKAQSLDFSIQANSGFSHLTGESTLRNAPLNGSSAESHAGYPNGTGNLSAPDLGADLQLQYTFKCGFILGAQAGFEQFSSKININGVYGSYDAPVLFYNINTPYPGTTFVSATGHATDHWDYIYINPYFGYRFAFKKVKLDVLPGFDIAAGTSSSETVNVKASDGSYYNKSTLPSYKPATDVRPRIGLAAYYQLFGIVASYSKGLYDYNSGKLSDSDLPPLHTELFRLGISYRIK